MTGYPPPAASTPGGAGFTLSRRWDTGFSDETKALVVIRQQKVPYAGGPPLCYQCGEPILGRPDFHHRKRRGPGDGRPSNCVAVHNRFDGEQCHFTRIHHAVATARANGWIILASAPLIAYRMPLLIAYRAVDISPDLPWIVLNDAGGYRQATPEEMRGDYDHAI
jgi:hypothetical protein